MHHVLAITRFNGLEIPFQQGHFRLHPGDVFRGKPFPFLGAGRSDQWIRRRAQNQGLYVAFGIIFGIWSVSANSGLLFSA